MKNKILSALVVAAISLTFSCIKQEQPVVKVTNHNLEGVPHWVLEPGIEDGIAAVGIANPSKGGLRLQIRKAELEARAEIAAIIKTEVTRITKDALRSAEINGEDDVENFFSQATKEVVKNIPLSGITRINIFKGDDGSLYVRMALKNDDYRKFLETSHKNLQTGLRDSSVELDNIAKSERAAEQIFKELDKERQK